MSVPRHEWRQRMVAALAPDGPTAGDRADELLALAETVASQAPDHDDGTTANATRALAAALQALGELERWEAETLTAEVDAERHRRAAARRASLAAKPLVAEDPVQGPLASVLEQIAAVTTPDQREPIRAELRRVALPIRLIDPPREPFRGRARQPETETATPRAVVLTSIDGSPVTAAHVISGGVVHEVIAEARVLDWPEEAEELVIRFLSRWLSSAVEVSEFRIARPAAPVDEVWTGTSSGQLILHVGAADPATPVRFAIEGQLVGPSGSRTMPLLGQRSLTVRASDPRVDVMTGAPALDERIVTMLGELRDEKIAASEQPAFARFFAAIARAGVRIIAERQFPKGSHPSEAEFQGELLKRLAMVDELGGRVSKHAWQGGGPTDLIHDGVVAELKVEKAAPATLEGAIAYLAQTTQYASGGQRQLSIMVILDMTPKETPPGVLANTVGWLIPRLHGLDDPAYPSRVGVVIVNGNLPLPSDWSR